MTTVEVEESEGVLWGRCPRCEYRTEFERLTRRESVSAAYAAVCDRPVFLGMLRVPAHVRCGVCGLVAEPQGNGMVAA